MDRNGFMDAAVPFISAMIGGIAVAFINLLGTSREAEVKSREVDVRMVEIAVGLLAKEPTPSITAAREWAIDVVSQYSQVPVSATARTALLNNRLPVLVDTENPGDGKPPVHVGARPSWPVDRPRGKFRPTLPSEKRITVVPMEPGDSLVAPASETNSSP